MVYEIPEIDAGYRRITTKGTTTRMEFGEDFLRITEDTNVQILGENQIGMKRVLTPVTECYYDRRYPKSCISRYYAESSEDEDEEYIKHYSFMIVTDIKENDRYLKAQVVFRTKEEVKKFTDIFIEWLYKKT